MIPVARQNMNVRIYKKKAKRAKELLISDYGMKERDFAAVEKGDELGYELLGSHSGNDPLKGTPITITSDYWSSDTDVQCVVSILLEIMFWDVSHKQLCRRCAA